MKRSKPMKRGGPLKRGKPLRKMSSKRRKRAAEVRGMRQRLVNEADGRCVACGHGSRNPWPDKPRALSKVAMHEISNGYGRRERSLDQPFCLLPLCQWCNQYQFTDRRIWPEPRQLCLLMQTNPEAYDLTAYLKHTNSNAMERITQAEVDAYLPSIESRNDDQNELRL